MSRNNVTDMVFSLKFSQKKIYCVLLHMSLNAYFLQWFKIYSVIEKRLSFMRELRF